jgi:biotin-(acetyl-CoA carboxylase) ligase
LTDQSLRAMALPSLPPAFQLVAIDREVGAFERAVRAAPRGLEDGTVYWADRTDLLDMAVLLEPEAPAAVTLEAVHVLTVAACEALAQLLPPVVPVACAWPGDLILDGARVGGVRAALAPVADTAALPPWLVLGLCLQLDPLGDAPGALPDRTSLADQGAGDVTPVALLEAVTRYLLLWTGRWLEDGPAGVHAAWNRRCFRLGEAGELTLDGEAIAGPIGGLDAAGSFVIGERRLPITAALELLG